MHSNFGKLKWSKLFKPAIDYAENGFPMFDRLYNTIQNSKNTLSFFNASYNLYFNKNGTQRAQVGEIWTNPDIAETCIYNFKSGDSRVK